MLTLEIISLCKQCNAHKANWIKDRWRHYMKRDIHLPIKAFLRHDGEREIPTLMFTDHILLIIFVHRHLSSSDCIFPSIFHPVGDCFRKLRNIFKHCKYSKIRTTQLKCDRDGITCYFCYHWQNIEKVLDITDYYDTNANKQQNIY